MTDRPPTAGPDEAPPDVRRRNIWLLTAVIAGLVVLAALLPALVAYRYTAPEQRGQFVTRPWRGWSFLAAALRVPGDSKLKTSGEALRKAQWLFKKSGVTVDEVQLLLVPEDEPYTFTHTVDGRTVTHEVVPSYRFIWEVSGRVGNSGDDVTVAMLDYQTGRLLYDIRNDLQSAGSSPASPPTPAPSGSP
jgi:hypothetical protein